MFKSSSEEEVVLVLFEEQRKQGTQRFVCFNLCFVFIEREAQFLYT